VGLGDPTLLDIQIGQMGPSKEQQEKNLQVQKIFEEGVAANQAGNFETAIAKFTEAASIVPNCHVCYYNIGATYARQASDNDAASTELLAKAEENYKKSVEMKSDYAEGWNALVRRLQPAEAVRPRRRGR
jgi:tetratricopeptide (TPR) repeat protein